MKPSKNRRWLLASRPHGAPVEENFRFDTAEIPEPGDGEILLRTVFLSLDPYMRGRMSDEPILHPLRWVLGYSGWQDYALSTGEGLIPLGQSAEHPSWTLGILSMPGFTGWMGLLDMASLRWERRWLWGPLPVRWGREMPLRYGNAGF